MYLELEYIYDIFNQYKFLLYKKEISSNKILLEFCQAENIIDKFSILLTQNVIETIIPLKLSNKCYKTISYDFNNTLNYLKFHIENYCNNKYI